MQVDAFLFARRLIEADDGRWSVDTILWDVVCRPGPTRLWVYVAISFEPDECQEPKHLVVRILDPEGVLVGGFEVQKNNVDVDSFDGRGYAVVPVELTVHLTEPGVYVAELLMNGNLAHTGRLSVRPIGPGARPPEAVL